MFCTKCGAPVAGRFCPVCGTPASQSAPPPPPAPPAPPAPEAPYAGRVPPTPQAPYAGGVPPTPVPPFAGGSYPAQPPAPVVWDYATWGTRVLGYLIDSVLVSVAAGVLIIIATTVFGGLMGLGSGFHSEGLRGVGGAGCCCIFALFPIAMLLVGLWNKVYLVAQRGSSIGQWVVKIKVVNAQGHLLTQGQALLRLLAHVGLSFVPLGGVIDLLWPLWDDRRQTLHDKAVGCYVIANPAGR